MDNLFLLLTFPIAIITNLLDMKYNTGDYGEKLPYKPRIINFIWAAWFSFFWLPCPLCNRNFGGHEWKESLQTSISGGEGVCPKCVQSAKELNIKNKEMFHSQSIQYYKENPNG